MGGNWEVVDQSDWRPAADAPRSHPGWEVVVREEPMAAQPRRWLPSQRLVDVVLGTVIHLSVGLLLTLAVLKLLIELAA